MTDVPLAAALRRRRRRDTITAYAFLSPWLIGFTGLLLIPLVVSGYLSLTDYELLRDGAGFVGLDNYRTALGEDEAFRTALGVSARFVLFVVPLELLLGLGLALLLDAGKGSRLLRTLYFAPVAMTGVAGSLAWLWILEPQFGLLNNALGAVGVEGPDWLVSSSSDLDDIALITIWT